MIQSIAAQMNESWPGNQLKYDDDDDDAVDLRRFTLRSD